MIRLLFVSTALLLTIASSQADADITVSFVESESGVTVTGAGSLATLAGLTFVGDTSYASTDTFGGSNGVFSGNNFISSATESLVTQYTVDTSSFDSWALVGNNGQISLDADPGVSFGVSVAVSGNVGRVNLPRGYVANQEIDFSVFNAGRTLGDFGLETDTINGTGGVTWVTGNGGTESILFTSSVAVPEPLSACPVLLGMLTVGLRRKRRITKR